jgi:hypothetical protein
MLTRILVVIITLSIMSGCGFLVDENQAVQALQNQGFKDVRITAEHRLAPNLFGCAESDKAAFEVTATNINGKRVNAIVCMGWPFKGATVRYK